MSKNTVADSDLLRRYGHALIVHESNEMPERSSRWDDGEYILTPEAERMRKRRAVSGKALRKIERELQARARTLCTSLAVVLAGCSGGLVVYEPETYDVAVTVSAHSDGKVTAAAVCEPGDALVSGSCQIWGSTSELTNDGPSPVQDRETCDGCTVEGWVCGGYRGRLRASAVCEVQ